MYSIDCRVFKISMSVESGKHFPQGNSIIKTFSLKVFFPPENLNIFIVVCLHQDCCLLTYAL